MAVDWPMHTPQNSNLSYLCDTFNAVVFVFKSGIKLERIVI